MTIDVFVKHTKHKREISPINPVSKSVFAFWSPHYSFSPSIFRHRRISPRKEQKKLSSCLCCNQTVFPSNVKQKKEEKIRPGKAFSQEWTDLNVNCCHIRVAIIKNGKRHYHTKHSHSSSVQQHGDAPSSLATFISLLPFINMSLRLCL